MKSLVIGCSSESIQKEIKSKSGWFSKAPESANQIRLRYASEWRDRIESFSGESVDCHLSYATASPDLVARGLSESNLNVIPFNDPDSALQHKIMTDWLEKNSGVAAADLSIVFSFSDAVSTSELLEFMVEHLMELRGPVVLIWRSAEQFETSLISYPDGRLDGAIIGDLSKNFKAENIVASGEALEHLKKLPIFENVVSTKKSSPAKDPSIDSPSQPPLSKSSPRQAEKIISQNATYTVMLESAPDVVQAIKVARELYGYNLRQAKDLVDTTPVIIDRNVSSSRAEEIKTKFEKAKATVKLHTEASDEPTAGVQESHHATDISGVTILSCDIEVFGFRNGIDSEPDVEVAKRLISSVGLEAQNSLSSSSTPAVICYRGGRPEFIQYDQLSDSDVSGCVDEAGSINIIVRDLSDHDWDSALVYMSGDADARILALGIHPRYDDVVRQIYDCGDLDTGIVEDPDFDLYMTEEVRAMYESILGVQSK